MKIDEKTVRTFYQRLNHSAYGATELVAIKDGKIVATGFFDDEDAFVAACCVFNECHHVYVGRNPRPLTLSRTLNVMDTVQRLRGKDSDIHMLTAISLDIDPIRPRDQPASSRQRKEALCFTLNMQWDLRGWVDDSGNGCYLWIPFKTPIEISDANRDKVKAKCKLWQEILNRKYRPENYGLRIDGCFDPSRIKRVIGTINHKGGRTSRILKQDDVNDRVRNEILSLRFNPSRTHLKEWKKILSSNGQGLPLPVKFTSRLEADPALLKIWQNPDANGDTSRHDWLLGLECIEIGISKPTDLAAILMRNPWGKFQRDNRKDYVETTVRKLVSRMSTSGKKPTFQPP